MSTPLLAVRPPLRHRVEPLALREVTSGAAPYPGTVIVSEGRPVVAVAADEVAGTGLWAAAGEHVLAPLDVIATRGGPAVLVPTLRVDVVSFVAGRGTLDAGEAVTLTVSMLRGAVAERETHPHGSCVGTWWIDDEGTPLFVHQRTGMSAAAAASAVLTALVVEHEITATAVADAAIALDDPERLAGVHAAREDALFAAAAPEALAIESRAPSRAGVPAQPGPTAAMPASAGWQRFATAMDGSLADAFAEAVDAVRQRLRRRQPRPDAPRSRRPLLLVAAAVVALVLAIGLLWPAGDSAAPSSPVVTGVAHDAATPLPSEPADAVAEEEPADAARRLLAAWFACGDDANCRADLEETAITADPSGAAGLADVSLTLLDDLGGMLLFRADDPRGAAASQVVGIVRTQDEWVLRGIHDVAQHP